MTTLEPTNENEAIVVSTVGSSESAFRRSLESDGRFCVGTFGRVASEDAV
jgi:hypothetical protein